MDRIGLTQVTVKEIKRIKGHPLLDDWKGRLVMEGSEEMFSTEVDGLEVDESYRVVYERTERLSGEPIIKVHQVIDDKSRILQ